MGMTDLQALALLLLEDGPVSVRELAALVGASRVAMRGELDELLRSGAAQRLPRDSWALAGYVPPERPHAAARPRVAVPGHRRCRVCRLRYVQADGLCRACGRASGAYELSTVEADAARLERMGARVPVLAASALEAAAGGVVRTVDGQEYEVVFDGRQSLIGNVDGMHSPLSGTGCRVVGL